MKAWVVREHGPPETLAYETIEEPPSRPRLVRIAVRAAGVNFADLLTIAGTYQVKPELPFVPGAEVAGVVLDAPDGSRFVAGDRVAALVLPDGLRGGYAEVTLADTAAVTAIPAGMPFEDAAAFFAIYLTSWFGLHRRAGLREGEVVLVHAGAGGVGSAAIQLAKAAGARVVATAGSEPKLAVCRQLGADVVVDYSSEDFVGVVKDFTGGRGADVVYDPVGGDVFLKSTKCIASEGRIVVVGFTSGEIPSIAANHVMVKNYSVVGLHYALYMQRAPELVDEATRQLLDLYELGVIRPHISRTAPLAKLVEVLGEVARRETTGKVVLTVGAGSAG